ncbi:MAG TPA: hypothetical protein GXZ23_04225 [Clostridiales bacterium]|nr:hypothetical protein [Clostridiales bacterium]
MSDFVFASYIKELKSAWQGNISNEYFIQLLYDSIVMPEDLYGKNDHFISVTKKTASELINRKINVHAEVVKAAYSSKVTESINGYFKDVIICSLNPDEIYSLIGNINKLVKNDIKISKNTQKDIKKLAKKAELVYEEMEGEGKKNPDKTHLSDETKNALADFLVRSFRLSISVPNKLPKDTSTPKKIKSVPVPEQIEDTEDSYTDALLAAYGQIEGIKDFHVDMLDAYPNHKNNFQNQRKYYFAAEAVRRGIRDSYLYKNEDQFEILKDEVYEGVNEVWEDDAKNGLARMRKVLTQATVISLDKCLIYRKTQLVGNAERKGVCHFLVNDKKLKGWVRDDDEQAV